MDVMIMQGKIALVLIRAGGVAGFILMIVVNALANILPINGKTTSQVSDMYPNLFTPIGLTFSIWGVIYLFLLLYTLYQTGALGRLSGEENARISKIGVPYILSCLANTAWILCWHYDYIALSVVVMLALLSLLVLLYLKTRPAADAPLKFRVLVAAPFSLYFGWITVATIANISALLVGFHWGGLGVPPDLWTVAVITVAVLLTVAVQHKHKDVLFSYVVIWALLGIFIRHMTTFQSLHFIVLIAAGLAMTVIFAGNMALGIKNRHGGTL